MVALHREALSQISIKGHAQSRLSWERKTTIAVNYRHMNAGTYILDISH